MLSGLRGAYGKIFLVGAIVFFIAVDLLIGVVFGWVLAGGVLAAAAGWAAAIAVNSKASADRAALEESLRRTAEQLEEESQRRLEDRRRLDLIVRLNRSLAEVGDERALMGSVLCSINEITGALGSSFVPVDEWRQPLPPYTFGQLPEPVLRAWSLHLASGMLRERCGSCQVLHSKPGGCPLHPQEVGGALSVYCLPLQRVGAGQETALPLGVLHLYLPSGHALDGDLRGFLHQLMPEIALAYETAHLRAQEMTTLRQIHLLHTADSDFSATLGSLLDGLMIAVEADCVAVKLRKSTDERFSNLSIARGEPCSIPGMVEEIFAQVIAGEEAASAQGSLPVWLGLPLRLPEGPVLGMLLASSNMPREFHARQRVILQTVAVQIALLIENERLLRELEYKVIVQERTRLAREIHDGLAQTLAFLKLQSAQMQNYLAQGDLKRLSQVLKENYLALGEAYLDTRQSIDNLRLTPQEGLFAWLERALRELEQLAVVRVERKIEAGAQEQAEAVAPEIQVQLIRIVQETLSNIRKHSNASAVLVSLRQWHQDLILEISDNGIGFDADDVPEISRHGLRGMRERAELIGAEFQVVSQAQSGTTIRLTIPILAEEAA